MRHVTTALFGLLASMVVAGCNTAAPTTTSDPTTVETSAKNVSMSLTAQGSADASIKLHIFVKATHEEIFEQAFQMKGGSTTFLQLEMPTTEYTFQVDAFADVEQTISVGTSSSDCTVEVGHMAEVSLVINTDIKGSAGIDISTNDAPVIGDVSVKLNTSLDIAASIHVEASDSDSKNLHFFWTGFGIEGTIEGSADLTISVDAAIAALGKGEDTKLTCIVQDELGASAHISIDVSLELGADGSLGASTGTDTGADTGTDTSVDTSVDASLEAALALCLDVHASCTASCKVAAATSLKGAALLVSCLAECGLELATCESTCGCAE